MMGRVIWWWLTGLILLGRASSWDIALDVTTQIDGAYGGEPFLTQPVVTVNNLKGSRQSKFLGRVTAQLITADDRHVVLRKEGGAGIISQDVSDGRAAFSGLRVDRTGEDYHLKFILYDEYDLVMGSANSDPFAVELGERFTLEIISQPENAYGGDAFGNQPVLAIKDRGGNVVTNVNEGAVTVSMLSRANGAILRCLDEDCFTAAIINGVASFSGLYINEAATHYSLGFTVDLSLDGLTEVVSNTFSVGIGPASSIVLTKDASDGSVFGGKAFKSQPRAKVLDMGGNIVETDSSSAIQISFYSNPSDGSLSPLQATMGYLQQGIVQFRALSIDKAGEDYRLSFRFFRYDSECEQLVNTDIVTLGSPFNVEVGQPHRLSILQESLGGWAGNQPFPVQPIVALVDAGGNVVVDDSAAIVTAELTPSISYTSHIVVDTSNDAAPGIARVSFRPKLLSDERNVYGPGDIVEMIVEFTHEVTLFPEADAGDAGVLPSLALNVIRNGSAGEVLAELSDPPKETLFSDTLLFKYLVNVGDSQIALDYLTIDAFQCNDYGIKDAFGRSPDLSLPALGSGSSLLESKTIGVSDSRPAITSVAADLPEGLHVFGAGTVVDFVVSFDREVRVTGQPKLPLRIDSTVAVIDTFTSEATKDGSHFFVTYGGGRSDPISWNASALEVKSAIESIFYISGEVCVSRDQSPNAISTGGFRWVVRLESIDDDVFGLGVDSNGMDFSGANGGSIQMQLITTDGILAGWTPNDGDLHTCTTRSATYFQGSGSRSLYFRFQVLNSDHAESLDINGDIGMELIISDLDDISLLINTSDQSPTKAGISIEGMSLQPEQTIIVNTDPPTVTSIIPQPSTTPNGLYAAGDALYFQLTFDKPVEVEIGLELQLNAGDASVARYFSGSGTQTLLLEYLVQEGDSNPQLDFKDSEALVAQNTEGGRPRKKGYVREKSTLPSTNADLDLSHVERLSVSHNIGIDGMRPTLIDVYITESDQGRTLARGEEFSVLVEFSSPVEVDETEPPVLGLLAGLRERWATYVSGRGSSTLTFVYTVLVGDAVTPLGLKYTRICRKDECNDLAGLVMRHSSAPFLNANLQQGFSDEGVAIASSPEKSVTIDTSFSPRTTVETVQTSLGAGTYTAGTIIDIDIKFSDDVFISGSELLMLWLNTNSNAVYSSGDGTNTLSFRYTTKEEDTVSALDWALHPSTNSAIICPDGCRIMNGNQEDVNDSFDAVDQVSTTIVLDPSPPKIVAVRSDKGTSPYCHPLCLYTVGEEISVVVHFDRPVVALGVEISLVMDVGDDLQGRRAVFDPHRSSGNQLVFVYTVHHGHSSRGSNLNYLCEPSHCTVELGAGTRIKAAANQPTVDADLTLPPPTIQGITNDDSSSTILIDTSHVPQVVAVSSTNPDGTYSPGDIVEIIIEFSQSVVVSGEPFLTLDVGRHDGIATFKGVSGSTNLVFQYKIGVDHWAFDLDYVDVYSLYVGYDGVHQGSIRQASTHPTIDALTDLPFPSAVGSLGHSSHLAIDSRKPYITSITATSLSSPSVYNTGDEITIQVQFSRPVSLQGRPSLKLETGVVDRYADFESQPDEYTLEFVYTVQLGDSTARLDYWSDDELLPSSETILKLNGGWIRSSSTNPILDADLHINPVGGYLDGNKSWIVNEGIAPFRDLKIAHRGKNYKVRYKSNSIPGGVLEASEVVGVGPSIEYEVLGDLDNRDPGDNYGSAVSIHNDMLAVGAPGKTNPVHEIQVLTVYSETSTIEHEVQIITTSVNRDEAVMEIQEFSTCADAEKTVGGLFELTYKAGGSYAFASHIMKVESDATAEKLKTTLESELKMPGLVSTSRISNPGCESHNSWTWSVTFLDSSLRSGILETNGDALSGSGAHITPTAITRNVDMLQGTFKIINPFNGKETRQISYDAPGNFLKDAIQSDLSIAVRNIQAENMDTITEIPELGRRWTIFFSHHLGPYGLDINVPQLEVSNEDIRGSGAIVWSQTAFEGRSTLGGSFAVSFRGSELSQFVKYDSSKDELAAALESLNSINDVRVSGKREFRDEAGKSGVAWTIAFLSVNKLTGYGWLLDPNGISSRGNLPTLEIESHLIGWNAGYRVESETGRGREDTQAQWMEQQMGDDGSNSGSVDVFRRFGEIWRKEATIVASDYNSQDLFGNSLTISGDFLLVGAPSKEVNGSPEQQSLMCNGPASGGFFILAFRGFQSSPIPFDATLDDMKRAIAGIYGETTQIHTFPRLILSTALGDWDGSSSGFCTGSENSVSMTFTTPDGGGVSTVEHRSGDIEEVTIVSETLIGASLHISESRVGTRAPMGKDLNHNHATGKQSGSAYLYKRSLPCITCTPSWLEHKKFTPLDGIDDATNAARFGWSTKFVPATESANALVVIGSPGFDHESGKVYIFEQDELDNWLVLESLTDRNWNHGMSKGGRFGSSLDADHDTILVGSPGYSNGKGAVYVFRRSNRQRKFLASQAIYGPGMEEGDQFGHSIALSDNKSAICAPYKTVSAIHIDSITDAHATNAGACYVFSRKEQKAAFQLEQQLAPSNVLRGDRFGWGIAMDGRNILVGQLESFDATLSPPRPVQVIKTFCKDPPCQRSALSTFRLRWAKDDTSVWSKFLSANTSANRMRDAINGIAGQVSVSRSVLPDSDGGHSWTVTFDSYKPFFVDGNKVPILDCEMSVKSSLDCSVHIENDIPQSIRTKTHLFDFNEQKKVWTEQAFLFPSTPQRQDMMGASVAIDGSFAVVGSPNRELLNVNSGAAHIYDINFLNLDFAGSPFTVVEGDTLDVELTRKSLGSSQLVSLRTLDRNGEGDLQNYINELYSLKSLGLAPYDKTSVDLLTGSTAFGRSQYYGSNERRSLFINGRYDFQGINDYELLNYEGQFRPNEEYILTSLRTNSDTILEKPNEHGTIHINLRGMFASQLGRLQTSFHITDDHDGKTSANKVHYQVLDDAISHEEFSRIGTAVDYDETSQTMIFGSDQTSATNMNGDQCSSVGSAHIFKKSTNGWVHIQTLSPPLHDVRPDMHFGQSVIISTPYGRDDTTVVIGAPGAAVVYVYSYQKSTSIWTQQGSLSASDATLPEHRYGEAIAVENDMAFVGAPQLEAVYVYRRSHVPGQGFVNWQPYSTLRSSDYDFDVYGQDFTLKHVHHQAFGTSIATSRRSLLIGAPFADYGNQGDVNARENVNTNGANNKGLGKGKVFAFYSQPHVQLVKLVSDEIIASGSFRLRLENHQGSEIEYSELIEHNSSPDAFKVALEMIHGIGEVSVETNKEFNSNSYKISWRITFLSSFEDNHSLLVPHWSETGCEDCKAFKVSVLSEVKPYLTVTAIKSHQHYMEEGEMQPRDVTSADLFGSSIDLDGAQAVIGSKQSSAKTRTTWDFETGDLSGWSITGDAFRFQPTYGDNSKHRAVYDGYGTAASHSSGEPQSSHLTGRYYIGTYEMRPGDKDESYQQPSNLHPIGSFQGDKPQGTLTSDTFVILGDMITFLIGGGCNHLTVYAELLVDGFPTLRATGKCSEKMNLVQWDVSDFKTRAGQIRVVDNGSNKWDHINVDDINFSWDLERSSTCLVNNWGECSEGGGALPKLSASEKQHYTGREESTMSGAAYMFIRECPPLADLGDLSPSNSNCVWVEQERISASDKRAGNLFGSTVSVDDTQGMVIVGCSNSPAYGFYQDPIFVHPHSNVTKLDLPVPENLGYMMKSGLTYSPTGGNLRVMDNLARGENMPIDALSKYTEQAGTVYVFLREPAQYGPGGELIRNSYWRNTEHAKISPPDIAARDHFGYSVSLGGTTAVMGAIGRDAHSKEGGGVFAYDMEWVRVKFAKLEYAALEGRDRTVKIFVQRDLAWSNSVFSIGYSTSDLSAIGVDSIAYEKCLKLHTSERDGCGDYEQAAGEVTFNEGEEFAYFNVRIVDDLCIERNLEYVQLNLHQIGGSPLRGENYRAQLRIDDNDW